MAKHVCPCLCSATLSSATVSKYLEGNSGVKHMHNGTLAEGAVIKVCGDIKWGSAAPWLQAHLHLREEYLMQSFFFMQFIFEVPLAYTNATPITTDENGGTIRARTPWCSGSRSTSPWSTPQLKGLCHRQSMMYRSIFIPEAENLMHTFFVKQFI